MNRILTITSNDLGISWGPAIHYLELWNEFCEIAPQIAVTGIAPSWTKAAPIIRTRFSLRTMGVVNIPSVRQLVFDARMAMHLLCRGHRYDLVYIRMSHWHMLQAVALKIRGIRFALELNGLALEDSVSSGKRGLLRRLISVQEAWLVRHAALCITVSDGIARALTAKYGPAGRMVTIGNGVARQFFATTRSSATPATTPTVIYVGTFTSWDGAADIVRLAALFPSVRFLMVGDGGARSQLERQAPSNMHFVGKVNYVDLPALYRQADAAIVLYEFERHRNVKVSSLKTLEYVASRLPVFTTDVPGQEYIRENGHGMLVSEQADVAQAFACFMERLAQYAASYAQSPDAMYGRYGWRRTAVETAAALGQLAR